MIDSTTTSSGSYIKITCYDDIDQKNNRLQLRTDPPTFIELKSGVNILSVKDYKDLKFGFRQDETISPSVRCDEVIEIDFSNFDGDNLVTMEGMFDSMRVEQIFFGKMNTPNLKNTARAFSNVGIPIEKSHIPELDVSSLDFSNVENIMGMFQGANIDTLRMENANLNSLKNGRNFIRRCSIRKLILDGLIIQKPELLHIEIYTPVTISLKRCKPSTICALIEVIETKRAKNMDAGNREWEPATYILDGSLEYTLKRESDGQVRCTLTSTLTSSVKELLERMQSYLDGATQEAPEIIWFEDKPYNALDFAQSPNYLGLAETLSENSNIAYDGFVGSKSGLHLTRDTTTNSITVNYPSNIYHFENGKLREKIAIIRSSDGGQDAVKLGKFIKDHFGLAVFIFLPYFQKEKISAPMYMYSQYLLKDETFDKDSWFEKMAKIKGNGLQRLDNFYLDFLKENPDCIDNSKIGGVLWYHPTKWLRASDKLFENIVNLFFPNRWMSISEEDKGNIRNMKSRVFHNGNLDFEVLSELLDDLPVEIWEYWYKNHDPFCKCEDQERINKFKSYLCSHQILGNMPTEASNLLLKFHGIA